MTKFFILLLYLLIFNGCESKPNKPMLISTNLWIGYSPLYYAEKKGWLREKNIKLIRTISLGESLGVYDNGYSDVFCGTKYEIKKMDEKESEVGNVILLDRSNGGDLVLSNRTIEELKLEKNIDVYLELESVNTILLDFFMKKYGIKYSQLNLIDSSHVVNTKMGMRRDATIIVTYDPYNYRLQKRGYSELASTKDKDLLVIDAIYISSKTKKFFYKEVNSLNRIVYKSLENLQRNPQEYYGVINEYFGYKDYSEFESALQSIEWIYANHEPVIENRKKLDSSKLPKLIKPYRGE